jgi:hypothetical protein
MKVAIRALARNPQTKFSTRFIDIARFSAVALRPFHARIVPTGRVVEYQWLMGPPENNFIQV